jgi:hypothetical protein
MHKLKPIKVFSSNGVLGRYRAQKYLRRADRRSAYLLSLPQTERLDRAGCAACVLGLYESI